MKNKYKVVALVPLEFSVEGSSDSKEAIESVKNIFEACRDDKDYADIVFDGIEESLRHDSIEYKVEAVQHEPEVKANSDIRSVASDICDIFENYLDENGICIVCDDADEERERKDNESGAMLYGMEYWHLVEDVEFRVNHINAQYKLFTVFDIMEVFDKLLISKKLGDFVPSGDNRYQLHSKILSSLRSREEGLE
jgi:hypothetical protein